MFNSTLNMRNTKRVFVSRDNLRDSRCSRCRQPQRHRHRDSWMTLLILSVLKTAPFAHSESNNPQHKNAINAQPETVVPPSLSEVPPGTSWWSEGNDEEDDDQSSSSSSDYESWFPFGHPEATVSAETAVSSSHNKSDQAQEILRKHQSTAKYSPNTSVRAVPSQPLQTLEKLQQMLDDTDYMTSRQDQAQSNTQSQSNTNREADSGNSSPNTPKVLTNKPENKAAPFAASPNLPQDSHATEYQDRLWTSADRAKYKQQQKRLRQIQEDQANAKKSHASPPVSYFSDDDDSDTEDGLGYTLPNLPIYLSDAECESDAEEQNTVQPQQVYSPPPSPPMQPNQQQSIPQYPPGTITRTDQTGYRYPPKPLYPPYQPGIYNEQHQYPPPPPQAYQYPPNAYGPYHYPYYGSPYDNPQQQQEGQQQQQQAYAAQQYAMWAAAAGVSPHPPYGPAHPQSWVRPPPPSANKPLTASLNFNHATTSQTTDGVSSPEQVYTIPKTSVPVELSSQTAQYAVESQPQTLAEASSRINFDSIQKITLMLMTVSLACYAAVSPRTLPQTEYNRLFYNNIRIVTLTAIAPAISFLCVFDATQNDVNNCIHAFYTSFSLGYVLTFFFEIVLTTLVRLAVFLFLEPDIFALTPTVPVVTLPWVLRENRYRPKRITLFAADFGTSCVASPILEEWMKMKLVQWTVRLPRNFNWVTKTSSKNKKKKRKKPEEILLGPGEEPVTTVNKYVAQMLAVSIGLKLADAGRRVLMYTKPQHADKSFYAICRGIFPIHELCGTMTALALAKRDILGVPMPTWRILAPAVVIHAMANFRGMKPIFKWNSATPWSEMQLSPWSAADASTLPQLLNKGFAKLMWLIILFRVMGYCVKNYYMTNRQAVKRTTTYAGKHAAFSADLVASEVLKKKEK